MWPTSNSSLHLGEKTIDRLTVAQSNLESLHPGPTKHDNLFLARKKPKTASRENNGSVPLPGGSNSRWLLPRRVRRRSPGYLDAAPSTAGPRIAAPSAPPVAHPDVLDLRTQGLRILSESLNASFTQSLLLLVDFVGGGLQLGHQLHRSQSYWLIFSSGQVHLNLAVLDLRWSLCDHQA